MNGIILTLGMLVNHHLDFGMRKRGVIINTVDGTDDTQLIGEVGGRNLAGLFARGVTCRGRLRRKSGVGLVSARKNKTSN